MARIRAACDRLRAMVSNRREHADFLALAIEHGVLEPDAAVDWACEILVAEEDPHAVIVELAGVIRPDRREVIELLDAVPGSADSVYVFRRLLGLMLRQLQSNERSLSDVTITLQQMVDADAVPEDLAPQCRHFDSALICAQDGLTIDTVDDVRRQVIDFLTTESELSHSAPPPVVDEPEIVSEEPEPMSDWLRRIERFEELMAKVTPFALQRHSTNLIRHYEYELIHDFQPPSIESEDFKERGVVLADRRDNLPGPSFSESSLVLLSDGKLAEIKRSGTCHGGSEKWSATLMPISMQEAVARYDLETCLSKLTSEFGLAASGRVMEQKPVVTAEMKCPCGSGKPFMNCHGGEKEPLGF